MRWMKRHKSVSKRGWVDRDVDRNLSRREDVPIDEMQDRHKCVSKRGRPEGYVDRNLS